jgi:hypothetical protein
MQSSAGLVGVGNKRGAPKLGEYISRALRASALVPSNTSLECVRGG